MKPRRRFMRRSCIREDVSIVCCHRAAGRNRGSRTWNEIVDWNLVVTPFTVTGRSAVAPLLYEMRSSLYSCAASHRIALHCIAPMTATVHKQYIRFQTKTHCTDDCYSTAQYTSNTCVFRRKTHDMAQQPYSFQKQTTNHFKKESSHSIRVWPRTRALEELIEGDEGAGWRGDLDCLPFIEGTPKVWYRLALCIVSLRLF